MKPKRKAGSATPPGAARIPLLARPLSTTMLGLTALCATGGSDATPPLPTPCLAGSCGPSAGNFVQSGVVQAVTSGNTLNVTQSTSKAILNWADFNIASGYVVNFKQPSSNAAVLNNIWSLDPSRIAGALNANGQVYLYNQNGIVFDKGAQVNVGGLTASTLALPANLFENGILSNNGNAVYPGTVPAVFQAANNASGTPTAGSVTVNQGAVLNSDGGRIMLIGSAVTNKGTITTPDGQTILGAGNTVYLAASTDPSLRGLLIEVDARGANGTVTNEGHISADRGNVTLAGLVVNQAGQISATTSVSANGSIYLVAGDVSATSPSGSPATFYDSAALGFGGLLPNQGGQLTLAAGSVTEITPDTTDKSTVSQQNLVNFIPSQVDLVGQTVALKGNATVRAPGGTVNVNAATDPSAQFVSPGTAFHDGGRIYLDSGSTIDVSGLSEVQVSATQNIVQVTLEGDDLQNDPLLRDGFLHGLKVTVDVNRGSTLFDVTPYEGNIALSINQVLTNAGTIKLNSDGDVIARAGSTLNVSGGSIAYQGGYGPATTKLLAANGKVYDISNAPNNIQYVGLANSYSYVDPTWGTSTQSSAQTYYPGYLQGKNAGTINILAPQMYLQGSMLAQTQNGIFQRSPSSLAQGGTLVLGCGCANGNAVDFRAPAVVFADGSGDVLGNAFDYTDLGNTLPTALQGSTVLSPTLLTQSGFDRFTIFSNGGVTLPAGSTLTLAPSGSLNVRTDQGIAIDGQIRAPGGTISLTTVAEDSGDHTQHDVTLGSGAVIDVSGNWINDSPLVTTVPGTAPTVINGGSVTLNATGDLLLGQGSGIDVSGGGWVNSSNQLASGSAGKISLAASFLPDPNSAYTGTIEMGKDVSLLGSSLAAGHGGMLALSSGSLTVGPTSAGTPGELLLNPDFFADRGFASYSLTGQNGVLIGSTASGAGTPVVIAPLQENLAFTSNMLLERTGSRLEDFTQLTLLPASQRSAASVSFSATASSTGPGVPDNGDVLLAQNASIVTDPGASVSLIAGGYTGDITVLGAIIAPAGDITLQLVNPTFVQSPNGGPGYVPNQEILLGPHAVLAAPAYAKIDTFNAQGYREGSVLDGGTISLQANKGYVVTKPGSLIDVRGTSGTLDIISPNGVTPSTVAGNAGTIDIDAREGIVLQGDLRAQAATLNGAPIAGAGAGTLNVGLDLFDYGASNQANTNIVNPYPLDPRTLTLSSQPASALSTFLQSGVAQISTGTIAAGGFDTVALKSADVIAIDGDVSLSTRAGITLDAPLLSGNPGSSLHLNSAYVALGNYFNQSDYFDRPNNGGVPNPIAAQVLAPGCAAACTATLDVNAQLIDVRGISGLAGFSSSNLVSSGDVRLTSAQNIVATPPALQVPAGDPSNPGLRSALNTSGDLDIQAQQVYPTTNTDFTITSATLVSLKPSSGTPGAPLSAGGLVTINAPTILQNGVLRAPLGRIALNGIDTVDPVTSETIPGTVVLGPGSITSVSANGAIIPYGSTVNGQQWTYSPNSFVTQVIGAPPAKTITLNGSDVSVSKGATVDLSGGGDLYAYEWIAGPGGSQDVLAASGGVYTYAILPTLGSAFAPIDAQYQQGLPASSNQSVYISGVPGINPGVYALLPARYALLPGAYALRVVTSDSNIPAGSAIQQPDGSYLVAGRLGIAGTSVVDSQTSTLLIAPGSVVRTQSQYTDTFANAFFSSAAAASGTASPRLPADAGTLEFAATGSLALGGTIDFAVGSYVSGKDSSGKPITVKGSGGAVSIQAPSILVVDAPGGTGTAPSGVLQLDATELDSLGAQTLVLGGTVRSVAAGEQITVGATQSIELDNTSVTLTAPEVILAAQGDIHLNVGSRLSASGTLDQDPRAVVLSGGGSLLRVSSGGAVPLIVDSSVPQTPGGELSVGSQASIRSPGSLLLYSTSDTTLAPDATISAPGVALYSSRVSLGDVPGGASAPAGLNLTTQLLGQLNGLTDLTIGSTSTIDFYGSIALGNSRLDNITLDAGAVLGYGAGAKTLQAGSITLMNSGAAADPGTFFGVTPAGTGALSLQANGTSTSSGRITLGAGDKLISGFGSVSLAATSAITGQGTGTLEISSPGNPAVAVSMRGSVLTGASGSDQSITTTGAVTISAAAGKPAQVSDPVGGKLSIQGASIAQGGRIDLPAGVISLHATSGDITVSNGASISVAGTTSDFNVIRAALPAGQISLLADAGNINLAAGSTLDVSGVQDGKLAGAAGTLNIRAPSGQFVFSGATLKGAAAAGQLQGNLTLDVASGLGGAGFKTLDTMLATSGFAGDLNIRTRNDSLVTLSDTIAASSFTLTADAGAIDVAGTINTSGGNAVNPDGGAISLWAGTGITLDGGARLLANAGAAGPTGINGAALPARGGEVTLGIGAGSIDLRPGSAIGLQGGDATSDGTLVLRAPVVQTASGPDVAISEIGSTFSTHSGTARVEVEGYTVYQLAAGGSLSQAPDAGAPGSYTNLSIGATAGNLLFDDAQVFAGVAPAIDARLLATNPDPGALSLQVRPGIEVRGAGDLLLVDLWDLNAWSTALGAAVNQPAAPVNVSLRAAGNLILNNSLSDGFVNNFDVPANWTFDTGGPATDSATYRLTAGADLTSANPLAVVPQAVAAAGALAPNSGNVILTAGNLVRTGNGDIDMAAGGDVLLGYNYQYDGSGNLQLTSGGPLTSVIYTAGVPAHLSAAQQLLFTDPDGGSGRVPFTASYATGGGNIAISASGDIISAPSAQIVSDWLWRRGSVNSLDGTLLDPSRNASWWLVFNYFQQGIAALGGGDLSLNAGGDIVNVSAVIPSTGRLLGDPGTLPVASNLLLYGGGYLKVGAGGNIASGVFEDDWGNARIYSGGALISGATLADEIPTIPQDAIATPLTTPIYPVLLAGAGTFDVNARSGIATNFIGDSTTLPASIGNVQANRTGTYFFNYTPESTVSLTSAAGDVILSNRTDNLPIGILNNNNGNVPDLYDSTGFLLVYPPNLNVVAAAGNIGVLNSQIDLFPAATGNLSLLAHDSITGSAQADLDSHFSIVMAETDPASWPSILAPQVATTIPDATHLPAEPLHTGDSTPVYLVAATGSISSSDIILPKAADIVAGADILDLDYRGKNLAAGDVTLIAAGGNIIYSTPTQPITNILLPNHAGITLGGPGYLEVLAGEDINLGDSDGIVSSGSLQDPRLAAGGASLLVGAGLGQNAAGGLRWPNAQAFIGKYLGPQADGSPSAYATPLVAFMQQFDPDGGLGYAAALSAFRLLTPAEQLPLLAQVLSDELSATGIAHNTQGTNYDRGFTAINTLFPKTDAAGKTLQYRGDVDMFFSQLKTEQGGNINLLAPGGSVVVGVPNPPAALNQIKVQPSPPVAAAASLGILVLGSGAVEGFAAQDFDVNQSRILTLEGGDIILWASNGNIDAGRGAKSASGAPPPVVQTDSNGTVFVNPINDVAGSGIGQLLTTPGIKAGLVNLIAPNGAVNAGDAGIRVAGNLNIAAVQVIGANNITVSGTATGVPVSDAGALSGALSGANSLGDAGKGAVEQLAQSLNSSADLARLSDSLTPVFIVVKMFCLGVDCEAH